MKKKLHITEEGTESIWFSKEAEDFVNEEVLWNYKHITFQDLQLFFKTMLKQEDDIKFTKCNSNLEAWQMASGVYEPKQNNNTSKNSTQANVFIYHITMKSQFYNN